MTASSVAELCSSQHREEWPLQWTQTVWQMTPKFSSMQRNGEGTSDWGTQNRGNVEDQSSRGNNVCKENQIEKFNSDKRSKERVWRQTHLFLRFRGSEEDREVQSAENPQCSHEFTTTTRVFTHRDKRKSSFWMVLNVTKQTLSKNLHFIFSFWNFPFFNFYFVFFYPALVPIYY